MVEFRYRPEGIAKTSGLKPAMKRNTHSRRLPPKETRFAGSDTWIRRRYKPHLQLHPSRLPVNPLDLDAHWKQGLGTLCPTRSGPAMAPVQSAVPPESEEQLPEEKEERPDGQTKAFGSTFVDKNSEFRLPFDRGAAVVQLHNAPDAASKCAFQSSSMRLGSMERPPMPRCASRYAVDSTPCNISCPERAGFAARHVTRHWVRAC